MEILFEGHKRLDDALEEDCGAKHVVHEKYETWQRENSKALKRQNTVMETCKRFTSITRTGNFQRRHDSFSCLANVLWRHNWKTNKKNLAANVLSGKIRRWKCERNNKRTILTLDSTKSYLDARSISKARFGNLLLVAEAYWKKINEWVRIPPNDIVTLRKFSDFTAIRR